MTETPPTRAGRPDSAGQAAATPVLSAVVYVGADASGLVTTLSSLARQDLGSDLVDVIVVNDSGAQLADLVAEARTKLARLTVVDTSGGLGLAASRVRACDLVQAERVLFLNSGSWLAPGGLSGLIGQAVVTGVDIVYGGLTQVDGLRRRLLPSAWARRHTPARHDQTPLPPGAAHLVEPYLQAGSLMTAEVARAVPPDGAGVTAWAWRIATSAHSFIVLDQPVLCVPKTDVELTQRAADPGLHGMIARYQRIFDIVESVTLPPEDVYCEAAPPAAGSSRGPRLAYVALGQFVDYLAKQPQGVALAARLARYRVPIMAVVERAGDLARGRVIATRKLPPAVEALVRPAPAVTRTTAAVTRTTAASTREEAL